MSLFTDIRHVCRALGQSPGFSVVVVLTLAVAIGANTAIYRALSTLVPLRRATSVDPAIVLRAE